MPNKKEALDAHEQYLDLIKNYQKIAKYWGCDLYRDDYSLINWKLIVTTLCAFSVTINCVYLFVFNVINNNDLEEIFKSLIFVGCSIEILAKMWNIVSNVDKIRKCHDIVLEISKSSTGEAQKSLIKLNNFFNIFGRFLFGLNLNTVLLFASYPLFMYTKYGVKEYIIPYFIPYVNRESTFGHVILLVSQFLQAVNSGVQFALTDSIFFYYLFYAGSYANFLSQDCKALSTAILNAEKMHDGRQRRYKPKVQEKIHIMLLNTIKRSQGMNDFLDKIRFFERVLLILFGCLAYSLLITTIVIRNTTWYAIYPFTFVIVFQMIMYSVIGTYVEAKFDRLPQEIYDIPWHHLPTSDQKMLMLLLRDSQSPRKLNIIGKSTMNVQTVVAIFKLVWSCCLMLDSFY